MQVTAKTVVQSCLIVLATALLVVGIVSGTLLRHVVQIVPIAVTLVLLRSRASWPAFAALPIFTFWVAIAVLIWLFLLGLSRIANGHYTFIEIVMTIVMAACSIAGGIKSLSLGRSVSVVHAIAVFVLFAAIQVGVMMVSFLEPIVNR